MRLLRPMRVRLVFANLLLVLTMLLAPRPALAAPPHQDAPDAVDVTLPVISPESATTVTLHTHLATIVLDVTAEGAPVVRIDATYDLRNETKEPIEAPLRILGAAPFELTLTQDGTPLTLTSLEAGDATAQIVIPANERSDLALSASRVLGDPALLRIVYPTELLRQWRGQRSVRVDLQPGNALLDDSWLRIEPESWRYGAARDAIALEWLFESEIPARILFQTIAPAVQQEVQRLAGAATGNAPDIYAALGQNYRRLAAAAAQIGDGAAQERFFAQAVAIYTAGIRAAEAGGAPAGDQAGLHAGLAELYRDRVTGAESADDAEAMVAEAGLALRGVMVDDPRRAELEQWQIDGLRLMLADLRRRGDIPGALALIEQLRALPGAESGLDFLDQERQALIVQQAVQLVEQGDRATALSLAGDLLQAPELQPPPEYRNLFARWIVSTTMSARGVELRANVEASSGRSEEARAALEAVVQNWRTAPDLRKTDPQVHPTAAEGEPAQFELTLHLPAGSSGVALARTLPPETDWTLLRTLLGQLGPQIQTQTNGLWQEVQVAQPLDLRTVGEQWRRMADELDRQAASFEANAVQGADAATLEASQKERLRAANYRSVAQAWREVAQNSQVRVSLSTPGAENEAERTWLVTVSSPPQMLNVQVETLSGVRVLLVAAMSLGAIFGLAAVLWRLL